MIYVGPYEVSGSLRRGTIGAFIITYTIFWGGFFVIITVVECAPNPILIIKAPILNPHATPYSNPYMSLYKNPLKGTLFSLFPVCKFQDLQILRSGYSLGLGV